MVIIRVDNRRSARKIWLDGHATVDQLEFPRLRVVASVAIRTNSTILGSG
jgi:hypothetical protein